MNHTKVLTLYQKLLKVNRFYRLISGDATSSTSDAASSAADLTDAAEGLHRQRAKFRSPRMPYVCL